MADVIVGAKLEADASGGINNVRNFKQELKLAQAELIGVNDKFGITSKEAANAAKKVAELKDQIGDAAQLVDAFNPDTKFRAFGASIQTVIGGFTALTGVMGLLGVESEEVQKTLLKVQSALALSQGIAQLQEGMSAIKNLGTVLINTLGKSGMIGIAIAGVAALGLAIAGVFDKTSQKVKTLNDSLKELGKAEFEARKEVNLMKAAFKQAETGVISKEAALKKYNEGIGKTIGSAKDLNEAEKLTAENADAYIEVQGLKAQANFLIAKSAEAAASAMVIQAQIEKEGAQGRIGGAVKDLVNQMKSASMDFDAEIAKIEAKIITASEKFKTIKTEPGGVQKTDKEKIEEYRSIVHAFTEIDQEATNFELSQNLLKLESARALQTELAMLDQQGFDMHNSLVDRTTQMDMLASQTRIQLAEAEQEHRRQIAAATAQLLDTVADLVGKQTLAGKIMAIASATINTYLGVTKALASYSPPVNFIMAAVSLAAGLLAIKQIVSVKIPGKGGGSAPSAASVAPPLVPRVPEATRTTLNQGQLNQIGNAATRAYVTETDMTNNQEKIRRINRAARIG